MDLPNTNRNPRASFSAMIPSNSFTFTTDMERIYIPTTPECSLGEASDSATFGDTPQRHLISLRTAFNASAPANHLPTELVVKILRSGAWNGWWDLVSLTHICQHWRNVALGTPQLWADAAQFAFVEEHYWLFGYLGLPTLLDRSVPCPLKVELEWMEGITQHLTNAPRRDSALLPHLTRLASLSVRRLKVNKFIEFVQVIGPHIPRLETIHMPHIISNHVDLLSNIHVNSLRFWSDADLPSLRNLTISAYCFLRPIAVTSLRNLVLHSEPRIYEDFLAALDRCAPGLESLTFHSWLHPGRGSESTPNPDNRVVHLPNLRHFRVSLSSRASSIDPLSFLFASLSFPPTTSVHLDWKHNPGNTRQLLPKNLVGLHAPPFFDAMCLHLYTIPSTATLHCYIDDAERLVIREHPRWQLSTQHPGGRDRGLAEFLDEHQYTTVTQLAIDLDMKFQHKMLLQADLLGKFISTFPSLRRLDLLGRTIGYVKLNMAKDFLGLACGDDSVGATSDGKTLGYVCEVAAHLKSENIVKYVGDVAEELNALERVLKEHQDARGTRLRRLEICFAYSSRASHPSRRAYPSANRVPQPSTELAAWLAATYLARFEKLVDEVVFVGHVERRGPGYRILPKEECRSISGPKLSARGEKGHAGSRLAVRKRRKK